MVKSFESAQSQSELIGTSPNHESFDDYAMLEAAMKGLRMVTTDKRKTGQEDNDGSELLDTPDLTEDIEAERAIEAAFTGKDETDRLVRDWNDEMMDESQGEEADFDGEDTEVGKEMDYADDTADDYDEEFFEEDDWEDENEYEGYGGYERTEELKQESKFELFTIPAEILAEYNLPQDLPKGVAVMGGTARSIARRVVTGDKEPVRDLDLVYIQEFGGDEAPSPEELDEAAVKYMPDDFAYGHGIKTENLENYFQERDFTINQCIVVGDQLMMTRAAYDDFQENIIRPSYYEQRYENEYIGDRLFLKALLMMAVTEQFTDSYPTLELDLDARYDEYYDDDYGYNGVDSFQLALTLNKAMDRGVRTAMHYTEVLAEFDVIDEKFIDRPLTLARDVIQNEDLLFYFRPSDGDIDKMDDELDSMNAYHPSNNIVKKALQEYGDGSPKGWLEPTDGKYNREDYDYLNLAMEKAG